MVARMTLKQKEREAKATALQECAEHMDLLWTDDPLEREQGMLLAAELLRRAYALRNTNYREGNTA